MSTQQTGKATLVIDNFSQLSTYRQTYFFFADGYFFGIYPKLTLSSFPNENVSVYWFNNSHSREKMHFKISILNASSEKLFTQEYNWEFDGIGLVPLVTLISRSKLLDPKNGYLLNDKLTLLCEAEIIDQTQNNFASMPQQELNNLSENLQSLLIDEKFSDVTLTVGTEGKKFNVHKAILASRSAVFAAMFEHDCEEKRQNEVKITDIDSETCDELLRYIYTGKVKQMDRYALDLLQAADKYQLESLKNMAEDFLCSTLSTELAANALLVADLHGATKLKDKCLEFISVNIIQVKDTDGWKALESNAKLLKDLFFYLAIKNNK